LTSADVLSLLHHLEGIKKVHLPSPGPPLEAGRDVASPERGTSRNLEKNPKKEPGGRSALQALEILKSDPSQNAYITPRRK
jgi:hypothetical protein